MTNFEMFNRAVRLTAIVFVAIMLVTLFTRPGAAQSLTPYAYPAMDYCERWQDPYGRTIAPDCDTNKPGTKIYEIASGIIGRPDPIRMQTPVAAFLALTNKSTRVQRVILTFYTSAGATKTALTLNPEQRFGPDLQDPIYRAPVDTTFSLEIAFLDGEGTGALELWSGGGAFLGLLTIPTANVYTVPQRE